MSDDRPKILPARFVGLREPMTDEKIVIAEFEDGLQTFCLNRENIERRIENLKKLGYATEEEERALREMDRIAGQRAVDPRL